MNPKLKNILAAAVDRVVNKEERALTRAIEKNEPVAWVESFYKEHTIFVANVTGADNLAERWCEAQKRSILEFIANADPNVLKWLKTEARARLMDMVIQDVEMNEKEIRTLHMGEIRADEESRKIIGYAAVFDSMSGNLGGFREKIDRGAFAKALMKSDVRALINHDSNYVLGRAKANTLRMTEDERGLKIEIDPPATQAANDLLLSISRGDIDQMSFAFRLGKDSWEERNGETIRTIHEFDEIYDVSVVTYPAYEETTVALRSMDVWKQQKTSKDEETRDDSREDESWRVSLEKAKLKLWEADVLRSDEILKMEIGRYGLISEKSAGSESGSVKGQPFDS
jgi:uncharacterized protein